jgi:hypothetical protein
MLNTDDLLFCGEYLLLQETKSQFLSGKSKVSASGALPD